MARRRRRNPDPAPRQPSLIPEIPHDERSRERLLRNGPQSLSDAELVAVLLKGGRPGHRSSTSRASCASNPGGCAGLANACAKSLRRNGVGVVKIATLLATIEIACRMRPGGVQAGARGGCCRRARLLLVGPSGAGKSMLARCMPSLLPPAARASSRGTDALEALSRANLRGGPPMTPDPIPEPDGPEDERFVYAVTAAGVEALARESPPGKRPVGTAVPGGECRQRAQRRRSTPRA